MSDWYSVTWRELEPVISKHGVDIQRGSLLTRLRQAYPDFRWNPTLFAADSKATPRGHWQNTSNLIKALDRAGAQLGITKVTKFVQNSKNTLRLTFNSQTIGMQFTCQTWRK